MGERKGRGPLEDKKAEVAKTPRYCANFTIQNLVCISMGNTFAFQNPGSIFRKSSPDDRRRRCRGNWDALATHRSPTFAYAYFIDNAYRVPSLATTDRRNKVPYECSPRRWLPFSSFRQILSRIVLWNGIFEISVGKRNRYRVQTKNIMGYEINLLDTLNGILEK